MRYTLLAGGERGRRGGPPIVAGGERGVEIVGRAALAASPLADELVDAAAGLHLLADVHLEPQVRAVGDLETAGKLEFQAAGERVVHHAGRVIGVRDLLLRPPVAER